VQNMFLGRERLSRYLLDEDDMERAAAQTLASLKVTTVRSIRQPVASLSGGQRQSVAISKAVMWNSKLVIMDEPTAALGVVQTGMVLGLLKRLRDRGLAVMVISHNLNVVFEIISPNHVFLHADNLVNLFEQSAVFMVLAMAETFALILGEIDLSIGYLGACGAVIAVQLVQPVTTNWPWWAAIVAALAAC